MSATEMSRTLPKVGAPATRKVLHDKSRVLTAMTNKRSVERMRSNENKMSDGGRGRAPLGVEVWKSSQKWSVQRSAVRSIAWLDGRATIRSNSDPLLSESPCFNSFWSCVIVRTKRNRKLRAIFEGDDERLA